MRQVIVTTYHPDWEKIFQLEALRLKGILGTEVVEVYHIGSTAVPGLSAKPIIDMMPVVNDITRIENYDDEMKKAGYKPKGENGIRGRRYFQKGGDERTHHVHIYEKGNKEIIRHLAFRDYLRKHPEDAMRYGRLKEQLALRYPYDIESYINGKHELALEIDKKALHWYEREGKKHD